MLRGSRSPTASLGATGCTPRSRCLGFISPRTATLLLALLGLVAHLQTFRHLAVLRDSFPHVPKVRHHALQSPPLSSSLAATIADPIAGPSSGGRGQLDVDEKHLVDLDDYSPSSKSVMNSAGSSASTMTYVKSTEDALAMIKPTRWFNLLPKRPWGDDSKVTPEDAAMWQAQQADQEEERKSWESARTLTQIMRIYAFISAIACVLGVYGVLKSNLASTRVFVISSFLDVFLFAFSVVSVCIIITYPGIRSMICEQISSGELHAFLSYMHGANHNSATPTIADMDAAAAGMAISPAVAASSSTSSTLPAAKLLSYATSSFWKRALSGSQDGGTSIAHIYWWDTLIDDMLENESCDDIFVSVLVPIGLLVCLAYLVLRIHFLFVVRTYYTALLRERAAFYLSSASAAVSDDGNGARKLNGTMGKKDVRLDPISEKPTRKYSSSSSSSSTVVEQSSTQRSSTNKWAAEKAMGEKMA